MNPKIKEYLLTESELPILLIAKLALYYSYLPEQLHLIKNPEMTDPFPSQAADVNYAHLNLF